MMNKVLPFILLEILDERLGKIDQEYHLGKSKLNPVSGEFWLIYSPILLAWWIPFLQYVDFFVRQRQIEK